MTDSTDTEQAIIEALEENARASYGDIAEKVGVSEPTVRKYIERLEDTGAITGYTAEVDPNKVSGRTVALVGIDTESDSLLRVSEEIKDVEGVRDVYITSGDHDILAKVVARDNQSLHGIISEGIEGIEGVTASHPSVLQERVK
ncbi:MAG: Lrp/AsnC family transcriptional regulator [Halobacteria archaeon]|nr:Lrp/AsnC family transcriptional regulator [Halobacteria archaeon]